MSSIVSTAYILGDRVRTQALSDLGESRSTILSLLTRGASGFHKLNQPLVDAAVACVQRALDKSGFFASDVDVVLIGTNSQRSGHFANDFGQELLSRLGLKNAYVQQVGFQNCGDSIPLLKTANALIESGDAHTVVGVIADDVDASAIPRVLMDSYVHSDGASAVVVSNRATGIRLIGSAIRHLDLNPHHNYDPNNLGARLEQLLVVARDLIHQIFPDETWPRFVISHNMNRIFDSDVATALNVPHGAILGDCEMGHCLASDVFINLDKALTSGTDGFSGDGILLAPNSRSVGVYRVSVTRT